MVVVVGGGWVGFGVVYVLIKLGFSVIVLDVFFLFGGLSIGFCIV